MWKLYSIRFNGTTDEWTSDHAYRGNQGGWEVIVDLPDFVICAWIAESISVYSKLIFSVKVN